MADKQLQIASTTVGAKIESQDMIALVVATGERRLDEELKDLTEKITLVEKDIETDRSVFKKTLQAEAARKLKPAAEAFKKAFGLVGTNVNCKTDAGHNNADDTYTASLAMYKPSGGDRADSHIITVTESLSLPAPNKDLLKKIADDQQKVQQLLQQAVGIRRKLADIPKLERKARAHFVTQQLSSTEEGRDMLASLEVGTFVSDFLQLPLEKKPAKSGK